MLIPTSIPFLSFSLGHLFVFFPVNVTVGVGYRILFLFLSLLLTWVGVLSFPLLLYSLFFFSFGGVGCFLFFCRPRMRIVNLLELFLGLRVVGCSG